MKKAKSSEGLNQQLGDAVVAKPSAEAPPDGTQAGGLRIPYRHYFWLLAGAWTAIVGGSLAWNLVQHADELRLVATEAARALLEKDLLYRQWSLLHGGVYVPDLAIGEADTLPTAEERQIVTPSGHTLTLLNPALVSRQIFGIQDKRSGIQSHLTSLKPLRAANLPDAWERKALQTFEIGYKEASVVEVRQGEQLFRMMRPLRTNPSCLRCHEEQDRKVGEVRGGISVTLPMSRFAPSDENASLAVAHAVMWLVGTGGLFFTAVSLRRHLRARQQAETEREHVVYELQDALAHVKTLRGLIPICSSCKKIRNDQGYWTQLETYLQQHTNAQFSHGICVDCLRKLYPEFSAEVEAHMGVKPG